MAKRFTDTEKWKDPWYISLNNDYRIIWQWLIDNCSHAGFCKRNMSLLNLMCRVNVSENDLLEKMENRVLIVGNDWFIPKFIKFQYSTLNSGKPAILGVVKELFYKNCTSMIPESFGNDYLIISKSFDNHKRTIKDKDKDKDKDRVKEAEKPKDVEPVALPTLGSEFVKNIAKEVWEDKIWAESICMGQTLSSDDLMRWMAQFNSSICNDNVPGFGAKAYKKMFLGWLSSQRGKGYVLPPKATNGQQSQLRTLKD